MWMALAIGSAVFAGITSILAKIGLEKVNSHLATALRTVVVLIFAWAMVFAVGSQHTVKELSSYTLLFLVLSGLATGLSWLCYFRALQLGDVNKVVPIDKFSTVLTMLLAFLVLGEPITAAMGGGMLLIAAGTYMMVERKKCDVAARSSRVDTGTTRCHEVDTADASWRWFFYAWGAAIFASLTAILGKIGISGVESYLGTAIRTVVVLVFAWLMVFLQNKQKEIKNIDGRSWLFILLSGMTTGLSWFCYYTALQTGRASIIVPIDKLSILLTTAFAHFILKEHLSRKAFWGLALLVTGTLVLLL